MAPLHVTALSLFALLTTESLAAQVVHMPLNSRPKSKLERRSFTASLQNYLPGLEYFVAVEMGTPPQKLELIVDTGSSDVWTFAPGVCESAQTSGQACLGGSFDTSKSSTYKLVQEGLFSIQYADGSGVDGDYIQDSFTVGGQTIKELTMASATQDSSNNAGIMGIGLAERESITNQGDDPYPNLPIEMVRQGFIKTRAYSLYLDDSTSLNGSLLFGGYDTEKFTGDLVMLDLLEDADSGSVSAFSVAWTSMTITNKNGSFAVGTDSFPYAATLDSGSTLISVPSDIFAGLTTIFGTDDQGFVSCDLMNEEGSVEFGFGGKGGPVIAVPFSEMARPIYDSEGNWQEDNSGTKVCELGIADAGDNAGSDLLFGQTLLRSAYVLYDLDNLRVGIAQAKYDSSSSNVIEYNGKNTERITSFDGSATPSATAAPTSDFFFGTSGDFFFPTTADVPSFTGGVGSFPSGADTIAPGVVVYKTTLPASFVAPDTGDETFAANAPSLTQLGDSSSGGGNGAVKHGGVWAVVYCMLAATAGAAMLLL